MDTLIKQLQSTFDRKDAVFMIAEFINHSDLSLLSKDEYYDMLFLLRIFSRSNKDLLDKNKCVKECNNIVLSGGYCIQIGDLKILYNDPYKIHLEMKRILDDHILDMRYLLIAIDFKEFNEDAANEFIDLLIQTKEWSIMNALKKLYSKYCFSFAEKNMHEIDLRAINSQITPGNILTKLISNQCIPIESQKYPIVKVFMLIQCQDYMDDSDDDEEENIEEKRSMLIDELVEYDGYIEKFINQFGSIRVKKEYAYKKKIFKNNQKKIEELEDKIKNFNAIEILKEEVKNDPKKLSELLAKLLINLFKI